MVSMHFQAKQQAMRHSMYKRASQRMSSIEEDNIQQPFNGPPPTEADWSIASRRPTRLMQEMPLDNSRISFSDAVARKRSMQNELPHTRYRSGSDGEEDHFDQTPHQQDDPRHSVHQAGIYGFLQSPIDDENAAAAEEQRYHHDSEAEGLDGYMEQSQQSGKRYSSINRRHSSQVPPPESWDQGKIVYCEYDDR